jgi:4-aminobutyrate---pyruvate transaminase
MTLAPNSTHARDIAYHLHSYTNLGAHEKDGPLVISKGDGIYVIDDEGNRYIEALSGLFCASLGFSEKRLVRAATRQMEELPFYHTFGSKTSDVGSALAEKLVALAPVPMSKAFFANSGSEANDTAVKLIWYFNNALGRPAKKKIIARLNAYHGVTVASASLSGLPHLHADFDLPIPGILHTDCPNLYRYGLPGESEDAFTTRMADALEAMILKEGPDTVAAFFAEPVMASGGVIIPPPGYYAKIQAVLRKYDILLVADEVICGFARTGRMFGSETFGMQPDIITCAKQLSGAYLPISAVLVNDKVYRALVMESEKLGIFAHGFTYSGHPVPSAVALETLKIYEERDILGHVRRVMPAFEEGVSSFRDHPLVGEARSVGLLGALELVRDRKTKQPFERKDGLMGYATKQALANGLIARCSGTTVTICPPLIITGDQIEDMIVRFGKTLDATLAWAREKQLVTLH